MPPSPESIIFRAIQSTGSPDRGGGGAAASEPRTAEESTELTNAVLSALHAAGYRIVRRDGRTD